MYPGVMLTFYHAIKLLSGQHLLCSTTTHCVISETAFRVQMLITGVWLGSCKAVELALIKSVTIKATKYVDIFGVTSKSCRTKPGCVLLK